MFWQWHERGKSARRQEQEGGAVRMCMCGAHVHVRMCAVWTGRISMSPQLVTRLLISLTTAMPRASARKSHRAARSEQQHVVILARSEDMSQLDQESGQHVVRSPVRVRTSSGRERSVQQALGAEAERRVGLEPDNTGRARGACRHRNWSVKNTRSWWQ